jgi:hypothetical protein
MPRYRVTISSDDKEAMLDLVRKHKIGVLDHGQKRTAHGWSVDAILDQSAIKTFQAAPYRIVRHEDVDKVGRERQREVGVGNRYLRPQQRHK